MAIYPRGLYSTHWHSENRVPLVPARQVLMSELSVHSALLIVNIPKITKTRLTPIHNGIKISSLLFICSALEIAKKANAPKEATDNKPDSH